MEPYEKVFVDTDFLETDHGELDCEDCHEGNPEETDLNLAHEGIIKDPSDRENVIDACGSCHEEITENAEKTLHYTLQPYRDKIYIRAGKTVKKYKTTIDLAMENHCMNCHSSCGQCHVSRPDSVDGGLVESHFFFKKPPMETNCTSCHGSRLYKEYTGKNQGIPPDVHFQKKAMPCTECHTGKELHAVTSPDRHMKNNKSTIQCISCHQEITKKGKNIEVHQEHITKLTCQVCHSMPYKNCYGCHVGKDQKGLVYYQVERSEMNFKIGQIQPTDNNSATYGIVRHVPISRDLFKYYGDHLLPDFDRLPTWKSSSPHNIQRKTPQNESCNHCHGKTKWFLVKEDVERLDLKANENVYLMPDKLPKTIK